MAEQKPILNFLVGPTHLTWWWPASELRLRPLRAAVMTTRGSWRGVGFLEPPRGSRESGVVDSLLPIEINHNSIHIGFIIIN